MMLNMDPPQHAKYRRLVQRGFTPRMIQQLEPHIRQLASDIIDRVAPRGECEFVSEVAAELPMQVICEMMGVAATRIGQRSTISATGWSASTIPNSSARTDDGDACSRCEMFMYASQALERASGAPAGRRSSARRWCSADVDGEKLSDLDFNSFFLLLAVAGNETTRTATSQGVVLLAEHPEQRERLLQAIRR